MLHLQLQVKVGRLAAALVIGLIAAGCASSSKPTATVVKTTKTVGPWYAVTTAQTPFFHYGPQQASGPDAQLPHDSIMQVIRPSFGYVKVQLQDGQNGYVTSEDIRPAAPALVSEKLAPPPPEVPPVIASSQEHGEQFRLDSNDPRLIAPPEPLPAASPTPEFRY